MVVALKLTISEKLEKKARKAGLLSSKFVRKAVKDELERREAAGRIADHEKKFKAAGIPPLTEEEIDAEIEAVRARRRSRRASRR
jgi:hypothetical protein